jgi:energy-coupling factor transport system substrate-specific component
MEKRTMWQFGTREVVYAAIGAALYGVLGWVTNILAIPGVANVSVRPAVAIPMFFGIAFGPIVGFISGFLGNVISDMLSGWGFWFWWDLGNGLMGLIAGLCWLQLTDYKSINNILKAELYVILGVVVGMGIAAVSELWVSGVDFQTAFLTSFLPAAITNLIWGLILVPILMVAYDAVISRSGR